MSVHNVLEEIDRKAGVKSGLAGTYDQSAYSTPNYTVQAATAANPPAGGTGATAGAYDTAANRDLMIASLTAVIADVAIIRANVAAIIDDLQRIKAAG